MATDDVPSHSDEGPPAKSLLTRIARRIGITGSTDSERRAWVVAWLIALALHAAVIVVVVLLHVPVAASAREPEVMHLVLDPAAATPPEPPRTFSELPKDRADSPPKQADFLSNVTSRARDREPGGQTALPRMHGESDAALVKLEREETPSRPPPPAKSAARNSEPADPRQESVEPAGAALHDSRSDARAESVATARRLLALPPLLAKGAIRVSPRASGSSDFSQPEMDSDGNAGLTGDVSLNTVAWDYAPWLERFSRQLMDHWVAPLAYEMGVLKDGGWCVLEVEISRSGEILHLELLDQHEHPVLTQAAESAVRAIAPMEHLPANFPEPTLILRLRMIYPRIRPR